MSCELSVLLGEVSTLFRQGRFAEGHDGWAKATAALSEALTPEQALQLMPLLQALLNAQQRSDLLLFADLLDHALTPAIAV